MRAGGLVVCLLLAGCAEAAGSADSAGSVPDAAVLGHWELEEFRQGGAVVPLPDDVRATLLMEEDRLGGTSFCNHYSAEHRIEGRRIELTGVGTTEMACAPELMAAETSYTTALSAAQEFAVHDGALVLSGADVELSFRLLPPVPTSELVGTNWVLETLVDGEMAASTTGDPAVFELSGDGSFTASTGCRTLSGRWAVNGAEVRLPEYTAEQTDCGPDVDAQDRHVTAVLADGFRAAVDGDVLTLTDADGLGLVYRAAG